MIKAAEAEAASKQLQGEGIANERRAIAAGIKDSVEMLRAAAGVETEGARHAHADPADGHPARDRREGRIDRDPPAERAFAAVTDFFTQFAGMQTAVKAARVGDDTTAGRVGMPLQ